MRIYVACLASYNNGVLHGRWIEASSDADSMQEEVDAMLRDSRFPNVTKQRVRIVDTDIEFNVTLPRDLPDHWETVGEKFLSAEEFAIHDSEGLPSTFGEYCGLKAVADFVELCEEFDHIDSDDMAEIVADFGNIDTAKEALDDKFCGIYEAFRDYADESADEMLACHGIKEDNPLTNYFDYEAFARDLAMDMHTVDVPSGVAVFYA